MRSLTYSSFSIEVPDNWDDITDELDDDSPITLAEPTCGVGALQISVAVHTSGQRPNISCRDLVEMLNAFGDSGAHTRRTEIATATMPNSRAVATFSDEDSYIRVWYLSDGDRIAFVTYTAAVDDFDGEVETAEAILNSFAFRVDTA